MQYSPDNPSGGFNIEGALCITGACVSVGADEGGNAFQGFGVGRQGASITAYYVFNAPKPTQGPVSPAAREWGRQNSKTAPRAIDIPKPTQNCACSVPR